MINSDRDSFCRATTSEPKEPVEHPESGAEDISVSDCSSKVRALSAPAIIPRSSVHQEPQKPVEHLESGAEEISVSDCSSKVRTLSVPAIIPRSPVHQEPQKPGLAALPGASASRTDGIKTPVELSSRTIYDRANDLFGNLYDLAKAFKIENYSTDSLFPCLCPQKKGRDFCLLASRQLVGLLSDEALSGEEKDRILRHVVNRLNQSSIYSVFQKKIFNDFFDSVFIYLKQKTAFKDWELKGAESTSTVPFYTSMHKLMIEGERRKSDLDWFSLNDEAGYLDRCCRAFMFLINELTIHPDIEVDMPLLNKAAAIIGSQTFFESSAYIININKNEDNNFFIEMLKKARIYNSRTLPEEHFRKFIGDFIGKDLKKESDYFYSEDLSKSAISDHKKAPYFMFKFKEESVDGNTLSFVINYKSRDKQADCAELLKNYYKSVADKNEMLEIIEEVVSVCCEIQRRHPIADGNGRLFFFILPSVLLYQKGIWLKETLFRPWQLIDSKSPAYIASTLVELCIKRPMFSSALNWKVALTEPESARVFCAMGELEEFKEIINKKPELLNTIFRSSNMSLLQAAVSNNRTEIVKYILANYPEKTNRDQLQNFLMSHQVINYKTEMIQAIEEALLRDEPLSG